MPRTETGLLRVQLPSLTLDELIADGMSKLKKAWPSAEPTATPVLSSEAVSQLIKILDQNTQKDLK